MMNTEDCSSEDIAKISRELGDASRAVEQNNLRRVLLQDVQELSSMVDSDDTDAELKAMAEMEVEEKTTELRAVEAELLRSIVPKDSADSHNAMLEIRAGAGGGEASLFVQDLFSMYQALAKRQGWRTEIYSTSPTTAGGMSEIVAGVSGVNVFGVLKHEIGTHRVQRVPATETQGRVHTSTATVAILPEASDVDVDVKDSDIKVDTYRSGGAGGQHVNTTDSAVRLTHIPTGVIVCIQDERSQHKNKAKAMLVLKTRIFDAERERLATARATARKEQVGTGSRSERIRTYNYAQDRVTDHRINMSHYGLMDVLNGPVLEDFIGALTQAKEIELLEAQFGTAEA
ncbi:hypothetical protein SARC_08695 [Sphaeroforma arctica JP610]|uniref:Prokaryotic-type class I peptide chain release factors domain-containing protein n=1 Tax=Sphaeroforma arctica JP610 TaxID=667725 RepID=A0A0L0FQR8_9EUKA|nr:hypothetical protein SARC_08695 [Sphaeroforma arctica JP610]KNC78891.1 hypothetical protein SARC_08695 [Sphaeroforma arctica JP610]|eukprot:XP_014152793.1 hypothetical protein SARC_08695 [Sphaeroforma arctica JP610]